MSMLRFEWMDAAMLDIQVMLLDHHIRQDSSLRIDYRGTRVIGGRLKR
jgi:hypothetical protein